MTTDLNKRAREILRLIVDAYVETGEPVGSRAISRSFTSVAKVNRSPEITADFTVGRATGRTMAHSSNNATIGSLNAVFAYGSVEAPKM